MAGNTRSVQPDPLMADDDSFVTLDMGRSQTRISTAVRKPNGSLSPFKAKTLWPGKRGKLGSGVDAVPTVVAAARGGGDMLWGWEAEGACRWDPTRWILYNTIKPTLAPNRYRQDWVTDRDEKQAETWGHDLNHIATFFVREVLAWALSDRHHCKHNYVFASIPLQWEQHASAAGADTFQAILDSCKPPGTTIYIVDEPTAAAFGVLAEQGKDNLQDRFYTVMDCGSLTTDIATFEIIRESSTYDIKLLNRNGCPHGSAEIETKVLECALEGEAPVKAARIERELREFFEDKIKPSVKTGVENSRSLSGTSFELTKERWHKCLEIAKDVDEAINSQRLACLREHVADVPDDKVRCLVLTGGAAGSQTLEECIKEATIFADYVCPDRMGGLAVERSVQHVWKGLEYLAQHPEQGTASAAYDVFLKNTTDQQSSRPVRLWQQGCKHHHVGANNQWVWHSSAMTFDLDFDSSDDSIGIDLTTFVPKDGTTVVKPQRSKGGIITTSENDVVELRDYHQKLEMSLSPGQQKAFAQIFGRCELRSVVLRVAYRNDGGEFTKAEQRELEEVMKDPPFTRRSKKGLALTYSDMRLAPRTYVKGGSQRKRLADMLPPGPAPPSGKLKKTNKRLKTYSRIPR